MSPGAIGPCVCIPKVEGIAQLSWWGWILSGGVSGGPGPAWGCEDKVSPGTRKKWDGATGAEVAQQLAVISATGSAKMSHVQPQPMGDGKQ